MKRYFFLIIFVFSFNLYSQITIDGNLSETQYISLATKQNTNQGFGENIDVTEIVYYIDDVNSILYLGVKGKLNVNSNDGIGIWLNISGTGSPTGTSAGNSLGGISSAGHYMQDASNPNFKADFEVDYMFAINPGTSNSNCYVDAASRVGTPAGVYLGNCGQSGSSTDYSTTGTVFNSGYTITFAFNNSGSTNTGFEIKIPFGAIGASSSMELTAFAFIVSNTAFFSNVTVPGNVSGDNLGFNPNFNTLSGGYYHSGVVPLPIQLNNFSVRCNGNRVIINWQTISEINTYGFEVERKFLDVKFKSNQNWEKIGFVNSAGNSNKPISYSYVDKPVNSGKYLYRLKMLDIDGSFEYSDEIKIEIGKPEITELKQNYPNSFNPETKIVFQLSNPSKVKIEIYSITGELLTVLIDKELDAGYYTETFNANKVNSNLTSGVYICKMLANDLITSENIIQTKKMFLIK